MNPALPGGAHASGTRVADDAWSIGARAGYTFVPYGRLQQGTRDAPNPNELAIDVHLATLEARAAGPTGTTLDLQLPAGTLASRSVLERRVDSGLGDLELRVRQSVNRFVRVPRVALGVTAGAVLPTGAYVARAGAANLAPEASYLTLGRGVAWWIAEADALAAVGARVSSFAQLAARGPLGRASDGFAWGIEVRGLAGVRVAATRRLALVVSSDLQWRDGASEPDPFGGGRLMTGNAGGLQWTASAAAAVDVTRELAFAAGVRVPLASDVTGNQLVPQTGVFMAVSYARRIDRPRRPQPVAGSITVVDYWASWCVPCVEIERALAGAAARWPDVTIVRVDATEGSAQLPEGARGLPAVEVFDGSGARHALLLGEDALRIVEVVDALRAVNGASR